MGLFVKPEATSGVSSDPLDRANGYANPVAQKVRIRNLEVTEEVAKDGDYNKFLDGTFAGDESITGLRTSTINFDVKLAPGQVTDNGDGTYTHNNPYDDFLGACGLKKISVYDKAGTVDDISLYQYPAKYVYYPSIEKYEDTLTMTKVERDPKKTQDGIASEARGAYGNMTLSADTTGAPFTMAFEFMGATETVEDIPAADLPNLDFNPADVLDTVADKFLNTTFRIKDLETGDELLNVCVGDFSLDLGNQRTERDCAASNSGLKSYALTGIQPSISLDPELVPLDQFDYYKALTQERFYEVEIESSYKDENGIKTFNMFIPKAQLLTSGISDDDNFRRLNLEWKPLGNKELSLPTIEYKDIAGVTQTFDLTSEMSTINQYEAMYYITLEEYPIGYTPSP